MSTEPVAATDVVDLVQRLEQSCHAPDDIPYIVPWPHPMAREAAAEIARLRAEVAELRGIAEAARDYYSHYVVDEAESADLCVCGDHQHHLAKALKEALGA